MTSRILRGSTAFPFAVALCGLLVPGATAPAFGQSSGRFQLVRSASGTSGRQEGGRFLMDDPRAVFQAGKDRQILVLFEWQGPAGRHRCEGRWRDPGGSVVFTSTSEVDSRSARFWLYWGLSLPDAVATGTWVLEALVDGEPSGVHAFQIVKEAPGGAAPLRQALSVSEIYRRGLASTLSLEVLDASGARLRRASGFFVSPELVSTSFAGLNGARRVRLVTPDGRRLETDVVAGWSRRDDWALLRLPGAGGEPPVQASQPPQVGDRGYFLDLQGGSSRVIAETAFIGHSPAGDLRLGSLASEESLGAPVLNEYGEIAAALAGSGIPGAGPVDQAALADAGFDVARGSRARAPVSASDATSLSETLEALAQAGAFVKPLVRAPHIVDGAFDTEASRSLQVPTWPERRFRFTRGDRCVVSVRWIPDQKQDTTSRFEVFDAGNRRVGASDPAKLKLRPGQPLLQSWELALTTLPAGLYRVDLVLGDADPVWRSYFHLTE